MFVLFYVFAECGLVFFFNIFVFFFQDIQVMVRACRDLQSKLQNLNVFLMYCLKEK